MDINNAADKLNSNGFKAQVFETSEQAKAAVMELIPPGADVGIGGSMTVFEMGLHTTLMEGGRNVFWHWLAKPEDRAETLAKAHNADYYLMSSNAVTMEGELINIDGNANRLGSMLYGPKEVIVICGRNKLVLDPMKAIERIKTVACPQNARRLKLSTPCATLNRCTECRSDQRMCSAVVRLQRPCGGRTFHVFLVNEDLGY